jgi:hypothetical protein
MSFISILKTVGKDLSHVGQWIDDGLKIAAPVVGVLDPPLAPVIAAVEGILGNLHPGAKIDANFLQEIVKAVTLLESMKLIPTLSGVPGVAVSPTVRRT